MSAADRRRRRAARAGGGPREADWGPRGARSAARAIPAPAGAGTSGALPPPVARRLLPETLRPTGGALGAGLIVAIALGGLAILAGGPWAFLAVPGVLLVLWLPGHALSTALQPRGLGTADRLVADLAGSAGVAILAGLALALVGVPLRTGAWVAGLGLLTLAGFVAARLRRGGPSQAGPSWAIDDEPSARPPQPAPSPPRAPALDRRGVGLLALAAVLAVAALGVAQAGVALQPHPGFTQLWMLPEAGDAVRLGVRNEEGAAVAYRIVLEAPRGKGGEWPDVRLGPGESWEQTVPLPVASRQGARLLLYRADAPTEVYRRVDLGPAPSGPATP